MGLTDEQKLNYYKNKELAKQLILQDATEEGHIVYGATAINAQVGKVLQKQTEDVDIMVKDSKKEAEQMEKKLDKQYGGDYFRVDPAQHEGTFKVRSNVTGKGVADYTKPEERIPSTVKAGMMVARLEWIKRKRMENLKNPEAKFRHVKDQETINRIRIYERTKRNNRK